MLEEESRKRSGSDDIFIDVTGKRPAKSDASEEYCNYYYYNNDDEDSTTSEIPIREETIAELVKVLERELLVGSTIKETCGPSFSDSSSTVMASIDMSGFSVSHISRLLQHQHQHQHQHQYSSLQLFPIMTTSTATTTTFQSYCDCESCLNVDFFVGELDEKKKKKQKVVEDEEQFSGTDETNGNGCDREEDEWLDLLLSWEDCPLDLID